MIIHCSNKLAGKLPDVSRTPLPEDSPLGSWHAHLYHIDRRQCVMFCHDATRFVLFQPGLRKEQFDELGSKCFRELFTATLAMFGCTDAQIKKAELVIGPVCFDTATDRSVLSSMRIVRQDLDARVVEVRNVMELHPLFISSELSHRPTWIYGKSLWPDEKMLELVGSL